MGLHGHRTGCPLSEHPGDRAIDKAPFNMANSIAPKTLISLFLQKNQCFA